MVNLTLTGSDQAKVPPSKANPVDPALEADRVRVAAAAEAKLRRSGHDFFLPKSHSWMVRVDVTLQNNTAWPVQERDEDSLDGIKERSGTLTTNPGERSVVKLRPHHVRIIQAHMRMQIHAQPF